MTPKEALAILKPDAATEEALKRAYRAACKKYHPDHGGDLDLMKLVNIAYETLKNADRWWTASEARAAAQETPLTETLKNLWDKVKHFPGLEGEVIGSWLWITGETRTYKDQLKGLGFKFAPKKSAWYYHEGTYRKKGKRRFGLDDIRAMWGSAGLESNEAEPLAA